MSDTKGQMRPGHAVRNLHCVEHYLFLSLAKENLPPRPSWQGSKLVETETESRRQERGQNEAAGRSRIEPPGCGGRVSEGASRCGRPDRTSKAYRTGSQSHGHRTAIAGSDARVAACFSRLPPEDTHGETWASAFSVPLRHLCS